LIDVFCCYYSDFVVIPHKNHMMILSYHDKVEND